MQIRKQCVHKLSGKGWCTAPLVWITEALVMPDWERFFFYWRAGNFATSSGFRKFTFVLCGEKGERQTASSFCAPKVASEILATLAMFQKLVAEVNRKMSYRWISFLLIYWNFTLGYLGYEERRMHLLFVFWKRLNQSNSENGHKDCGRQTR